MSNNRGRGLGWGSSFSSISSGRTRGSRAGYASRRGGGWGHHGSWQQLRPRNPQNSPDTILHPLGELIATFDNSFLDLAASSRSAAPSITDYQYVTSYNWSDHEEPTILVPGKPSLWTPLNKPRPLNEDCGNYFRDSNAARFPSYPTEPAVQALLKSNPNFPMSSIDVFACGSTMGNLLRFVRSEDKPFRFSVEVVDSLVFFVRKENDPKELIDGVRGYGHTFPENYTTWEKEVKGSETHQRVVQYRFGGLKYLVRFECDGYLGGSTTRNTNSNDDFGDTSGVADITNALGAVSVTQHVSTTDHLTVKVAGSEVPQESIFDLKTRSGKYGKKINMEDQYPSLWVKQIPNFVIAYHDGAGLFEKDKIHIRNVEKDIQKWEQDNMAALKRLAALICKIVDFAKASDEQRIDIYCPSVNRLEIREQIKDEPHVLPPALRSGWITVSASSSSVTPKQHSDSDEEDRDDGDGEQDVHETDHRSFRSQSGSEDDDSGVDLEEFYAEVMMGKFSSDQEEEPDYTACSAEDCGYCGRCHYD